MTGTVRTEITPNSFLIIDVAVAVEELHNNKDFRQLCKYVDSRQIIDSMLVDFPCIDNFSNAVRLLTTILDYRSIQYNDIELERYKELFGDISVLLYRQLISKVDESLLYTSRIVGWIDSKSVILKTEVWI